MPQNNKREGWDKDKIQELFMEVSDNPMIRVKILSRLEIVAIEVDELLSQARKEQNEQIIWEIDSNRGYMITRDEKQEAYFRGYTRAYDEICERLKKMR